MSVVNAITGTAGTDNWLHCSGRAPLPLAPSFPKHALSICLYLSGAETLYSLSCGGGWGDLPIQGMDKSTFPNRRSTYPTMEKSTSFNSRLTNLLLWMQWISLESLLNVSLQAVFYTYIVGCKHKWCRPTRNYCTCTVCSSVWVLVNSSRIYYSLHCTCTHVLYRTFHCPKFHTTHWNAPSESCINLWSTRLARQKSENSEAAQPLIGIKCHILSESSVKLW